MLPDFLTPADWFLLILCALLIGGNKAGLRGVSIIAIPIFAGYFGGRTSVSTILPLLITGDICSVIIYRKRIRWSYLIRLLPSTLAGLAFGMVAGKVMPDRIFRLVMAVLIFTCLILMLIKEFRKNPLELPDNWMAHGTAGFTGGFSTMVGNAAGPIMSLYLLSMNLPKEVFIGTGAVFFFTVNMIKVPVHAFVWGSMTLETLMVDAVLAPFVLIGLLLGLKVVRRMPERPFRLFIIFATLAGTVKMFFP